MHLPLMSSVILRLARSMPLAIVCRHLVPKRSANGSYETELTNAGARPKQTSGVSGRPDCGAGTTYIGGGTPDYTSVFMNFGSGVGFVTEVPTGPFEVILDGKTYAKFDLAVSWPLNSHPDDASRKVAQVYVPSFKIITDASGKVSLVKMWINLFDRVDKVYKKVTDYKVLEGIVENIGIGLEELPPSQSPVTESVNFGKGQRAFPSANEPFKMTISDMTKDWRTNANDHMDCSHPSGFLRIDYLSTSYSIYGTRYNFNFRLPRLQLSGQNCPVY